MKIVFFGTPVFSVPVLQNLVKNNFDVCLVVTQPDKPVGRGRKVVKTPVKEAAEELNIKVMQPEKVKDILDDIKACEPDFIVTCAYGQILPKALLDLPKIKSINVHASLLPYHRGGAPIHRAILNGDKVSGVSIMEMISRLDAGKVYLSKEIEITNTETVGSLHDKLSIVGSELIIEALPKIASGELVGVEQDDTLATFSPNISKEECKIDFNCSSSDIYNKVRAFKEFPTAHAIYNEQQIKIYELKVLNVNSNKSPGTIVSITKDGIEVSTSDFNVLITALKLPGKKILSANEFYNGNKLLVVDEKFE